MEHGQTGSCSVTPAANYTLISVSGCGGTWNGLVYLTGPVTAPCTVSAFFAIIDATPPFTTASPAGGTYTSAQSVTLTCTDTGGSGCSATYYCLGNSCTPTTLYTTPITIDSTQLLHYLSIDRAGNRYSGTESYVITNPTGGATAVPAMSLPVVLFVAAGMCGALFWREKRRREKHVSP